MFADLSLGITGNSAADPARLKQRTVERTSRPTATYIHMYPPSPEGGEEEKARLLGLITYKYPVCRGKEAHII